MTTLIDPFEITAPLPPPRPPMPTLSVDIDFEPPAVERWNASLGSEPDLSPDSWSRVRCWCSED